MIDIKYFIGKVCTVNTVNVNFRFKEEQMMDYFMGIIDNIDGEAIVMTHPITKCKNYIFLRHVVSITEEQILYENNPDHAKIIAEYKKEKPITSEKRTLPAAMPVAPSKPTRARAIDPAALADLAKRMKEI